MIQILLVTASPQVEASVRAVLSELEDMDEPVVIGSGAQAAIELGRRDIDLALVDEDIDDKQGLSVLRDLAVREPLLPVSLLAAQAGGDVAMRVINAGGRGVLPLPASVESYAERLRALAGWTRAAHGFVEQERSDLARPVGQMIAVVGSKGGVGTSMIALAAAGAGARRGSTVLIDLDLGAGDMASYCGIRVRHSVIDLVSVASEMTGRELAEVAYPVKGGIDLLPAPEHAESAELMTEPAMRQILQATRFQYGTVVADCGAHLTEASAAALDLADVIVVVATPEVPALRAVKRLRDSMGRLGIARSTPLNLVLNRVSRRNEIQPASASKLVGSPIMGTVPEAAAALEPALNTGTLVEASLPGIGEIGERIIALAAGPVAVDPPAVGGAGRRGRRSTASSAASPNAVPPSPGSAPEAHGSAQRRGGIRGLFGPRSHGGQSRRRTRSKGRRVASESGQTTVEFAGALIVGLAVLALCVNLLLLGIASMYAHDAAQEASRGLAAGASTKQVARRAREDLPGPLASGMSLSMQGANTVKVSIEVPGVSAVVGPASATADIDWEPRR